MKKLLLGVSLGLVPFLLSAKPWTQDAPASRASATQGGDKQVDKQKEAKIRELLALTGAAKQGKQLMDMMMTQFGQMPGLPAGFADKFKELAKPEDLVNMIVPIYARNVEERDLDGIIKFFKSESGTRWLAAQPKIFQESQAAGRQWGQKLAMKAMAELKK